jgi:hypothetical protein
MGLVSNHNQSLLGGCGWVPAFSPERLKRDLAGCREGIMARIPSADLNCVFYLYPDAASANAGRKLGGSGFWVSYESSRLSNYSWLFAVSNRHVVHKMGASVIRANARQHVGFEIIESEPTDWIEHPDGHDIAILPMAFSQIVRTIDLMVLPLNMFAKVGDLVDETIGIGDDVYMIGRFINHEGTPRNTPSVRFGNISMLPFEPIYIDAQTKPQESFAIEMRSMCGYSGSPVFVEVGGMQRRSNGSTTMGPPRQLFLGVHWGHIIEPWTVRKIIVSAKPTALQDGEREIEQVSANTGMNGVVPAWRLREMLDLPIVRDMIQREEDAELKRRNEDTPGAKLDAASSEEVVPPTNDANPTHREDFTRLVGAAARKPAPKD